MLLQYLHSHRKVVCGFRWEINVDGFLDEWRIRDSVVNFDNMQLDSVGI